jgi:hypothetical protein
VDRDQIPEPIAERLHRRRGAQESNGAVVRWLDRLGYRAEPSDVDIIVSRYAQERDATRACLRLTST